MGNVYSNSPAMKPISSCHQRVVLNFVDFESIFPSQLLSFRGEKMHVSPLVMRAHFLDVAIQYQELEENLNFLAGCFAIVVTLVLVQVGQVIQLLELEANQNRFGCHTTFPFFKMEKQTKYN